TSGQIPPGFFGNWEVNEDDRRSIVIRKDIHKTGWTLAAVIPRSSVQDHLNFIRFISVAIVITLSILAVFTGLFLANRITLPLTDVVDKIQRFGHGDFNQKLPEFNNHDLRILAENFNQMTSKIEGLMLEAVEREKEKEKAELIALEAQINPHFLYNTLEVVRGISLQKGVPEVSSIAKSLACIFRYSINREKQAVPLSRELENVGHYLNVQNYRYVGRFAYSEDIPDPVREAEVPRLMLQPVVENIFKHVIEERRETTRIHIQARQEGRLLVLEVSNDGSSLDEKQIRDLNRMLVEESWPRSGEGRSSGIGLSNVHKRLCLMNGEPRGLEFDLRSGKTVIRMYVIGR
ncbi:MAG: histidine kinase, partial [Spirochaetales bacterium]|nr:histidine kinase [Spirochaetales bacterium]